VDDRPDTIESPGWLARALLLALRGYQVALSPLFAGSCRYLPSCSQYMADAVRRYGAARGGWLGLRRLARCHPLGSSGYDPVPEFRDPRGAARPAAPLSPGTIPGDPSPVRRDGVTLTDHSGSGDPASGVSGRSRGSGSRVH
jgi:uncharacterized protein